MCRSLFLCILIFISACNNKPDSKNTYDITMHIRQGFNYYSIFLNKDGNGYLKKGKGSYYDESLKYDSVEDSSMFKVDSIKAFLNNIDKLREQPIIAEKRLDAARVEIYYQNRKVYDSYSWDSIFWDIVNPIKSEIPDKFNPFINPLLHSLPNK
jgi:hypothetical protein